MIKRYQKLIELKGIDNLANLIKSIIPNTYRLNNAEIGYMLYAFTRLVFYKFTSGEMEVMLSDFIEPYSLFRNRYRTYFIALYRKETFAKVQRELILRPQFYSYPKGFIGYDTSELEKERVLDVIHHFNIKKIC